MVVEKNMVGGVFRDRVLSMYAASVVSFVLYWLKQGGFPSQWEDRQHTGQMHFAHRENKRKLVLNCHFVSIFAEVGLVLPRAGGVTEAPRKSCLLSWLCPPDSFRAPWVSVHLWGICDGTAVLLQSRRGKSSQDVLQSWLGWGEAITQATRVYS